MGAEVYFAPAGGRSGYGPTEKIRTLFKAAGIPGVVREHELVAVKNHVGERGCTSFIGPQYVRPVIEELLSLGAKPFLTDTGCLYFGGRANARDHLMVAAEHGFSVEAIGAPMVIADGLRGSSVAAVEVGLKHFDTVDVGAAIYDSDSLLVLTHVTSHGLTGFAATIKNLGMGGAGRRMKLSIHDQVRPAVDDASCDVCLRCVDHCPTGAMTASGGAIVVDGVVCCGCGECIALCPSQAIEVHWVGDPLVAQEKMAEVACGVLSNKKGRVAFISFLVNITHTCDCWNYSAAPFVGDIGFLASLDPVAVDQAAADLVNTAPVIYCPQGKGLKPDSEDKLAALSGAPWRRQIEYAEELGLGTRDYDLVKIGD